jgi:hypothetical protein
MQCSFELPLSSQGSGAGGQIPLLPSGTLRHSDSKLKLPEGEVHHIRTDPRLKPPMFCEPLKVNLGRRTLKVLITVIQKPVPRTTEWLVTTAFQIDASPGVSDCKSTEK